MHRSRPMLLSGRIVLPDGGARQRYVLVRDGRIRWISRSRPPKALTEDAIRIETGAQDWIFPGLADLHTHAWYNLLPLWHSNRAPFDNRHVWRADPDYKNEIGGVLRHLKKEHTRARQVFSELQAVAGGTTVLDEPRPLDSESAHGSTVLCRDTGGRKDFGSDIEVRIRSVVDFFRPENGRPAKARGRKGETPPIDAYAKDRGDLQAVLVHLAEGRSGFGSMRGVDPYSRAEFEALMAHPSMADVKAVQDSRLAIVHGCGIDVDDSDHIRFLTERNISVIWSPASNMLLYGDSLDAGKLIDRGVQVCLGSDWSPSGSKHVWDEAKYARFFLRAIGSTLSDADVFKMVTSNPGNILGLRRLGRIEEGALADFFILRSPIESDNALEVFFETTDRDVIATIVDGLPIYGSQDFLGQFDLELQELPRREGRAVENKRVHLPPDLGVDDLAAGIDQIEDVFKALDPPTLRSNLLAESDVHYRKRMQLLRARTEEFGWSVRQWRVKRRSKNLPPPGQVPVPPDAVRVRVVHGGDDEARFRSRLVATLLPTAAELGRGIGLTALFSALPPEKRPKSCPREIGLWFFEEKDTFEEAQATLAGRALWQLDDSLSAYGEDGSWVGHPQPYAGKIGSRQCYHLGREKVDWYVGGVCLQLATRRAQADVQDFHDALKPALDLCAESQAVDAALAIIEDDFFALFTHASGESDDPPTFWSPELERTARPILQRAPRYADAKAKMHAPSSGLDSSGSHFLAIRFERRDLHPW